MSRDLGAVRQWLSDDQLREIYTAAYWNDLREEQGKDLWIEAGNYERCRRYLEESKCLGEYQEAEIYLRQLGGRGLRVVDLAAGTGWTSALMSRLDNVEEVHAVDISRHRLELQFPHCVVLLGGQPHKIHRYLGSFYDLKFTDGSMDVAFLSQAFHHADQPADLLAECDRILKPGGRIILVGEHAIGPGMVARRFLSVLVRQRKLTTDFRRLFPPDPVLGDHYYRHSDYRRFFGTVGYRLQRSLSAAGTAIYVADKKGVCEVRS